MFKIKCMCGDMEKMFKMNLGTEFMGPCCEKKGYGIDGEIADPDALKKAAKEAKVQAEKEAEEAKVAQAAADKENAEASDAAKKAEAAAVKARAAADKKVAKEKALALKKAKSQ